jgi:hypothetical protein
MIPALTRTRPRTIALSTRVSPSVRSRAKSDVDISDVDILPYEDQEWTMYMGKRTDSHYTYRKHYHNP